MFEPDGLMLNSIIDFRNKNGYFPRFDSADESEKKYAFYLTNCRIQHAKDNLDEKAVEALDLHGDFSYKAGGK